MKRTMLITGASRGIGAATARLAAREGYHVVINYYKNKSAAEEVAREIVANGGMADTISADVSQEYDVVKMINTVIERHGQLDVLINNAGVIAQIGKIDQITSERLHHMFGINVFGSILCAREAVKHMKGNKTGGVIVNVSSSASKIGSANEFLDYAATKGAIDTFTKGLANEVVDEDIRVNAVRPGLVVTDMQADTGDINRSERLKPNIPMKRPGKVDEIAEAIIWLASDKASYVTGTLLDVSGGR